MAGVRGNPVVGLMEKLSPGLAKRIMRLLDMGYFVEWYHIFVTVQGQSISKTYLNNISIPALPPGQSDWVARCLATGQVFIWEDKHLPCITGGSVVLSIFILLCTPSSPQGFQFLTVTTVTTITTVNKFNTVSSVNCICIIWHYFVLNKYLQFLTQFLAVSHCVFSFSLCF